MFRIAFNFDRVSGGMYKNKLSNFFRPFLKEFEYGWVNICLTPTLSELKEYLFSTKLER
ncbi:hypothetical protein LCDVSa103L [Lymphocystis disease virus 3]|uniref:Uncharacterized protein n=1 Tax=Lymphocystis disease virus 3 TaxID=2560566 RepID=A0A1B2RW17_9VIRU|nr:hypothetical protein BZK12_gp103 [Lymphocystis disease virus Sa]AOC55187.1 hypothetical protein LCDVSa103L [Lymphocystis disease virus 3]